MLPALSIEVADAVDTVFLGAHGALSREVVGARFAQAETVMVITLSRSIFTLTKKTRRRLRRR